MTIEMIPLNKLVPSPANVRKTGADMGIDELAASIAAHGLLQNLSVRPGTNGTFEVVAGARRLAALKRLAKQKTIAKDAPIPCAVREGDGVEISLAENLVRLPMHPADQFDAFKTLADQGKGPEEIAARFGCSTTLILQRLKLASVSAALLDAYRTGAMDLDQLMAFTVSDDHAVQETLWAELPEWNRHPSTIRRLLTRAHVEAQDRRARFVGIDAYIAAGGNILRDLFEPEHEGYLTDPALLNRLVAEKLERDAEALRAEGWKWVEIIPDIDYERLRSMQRFFPGRRELGAEQQATLDRLTSDYDALVAEHGDEPPEDAAAIRQAFLQPDAEAAHNAWRHVADQLRARWPKLAALMDDSEHDVLAYMAFPAQHRTKLHSTNPLERLNKEVKRRADVVGIFPNEASITRLIGAVLLEQNDEWLLQHRYMQVEGMAELTPPLIDADPAKLPPLAA